MKTLVLYYSYSGHTKAAAQKTAAELGADIAEIKDANPPGKLKAYTAGCFAAIKGNAWPIAPLTADLAAYAQLVLLAPIWAGNVPPAVNAALALLPAGKAVTVKLVSGSGQSSCREKLEARIQARGCTAERIDDLKGSAFRP